MKDRIDGTKPETMGHADERRVRLWAEVALCLTEASQAAARLAAKMAKLRAAVDLRDVQEAIARKAMD